jgi:sugar (pentulose or hexulose) kinase
MAFFLGIDFGTTGTRAAVIDDEARIVLQVSYAFVQSKLAAQATNWQTALFCLIEQIPAEIRRKIKAIAIDGTSSTVLLCDAAGMPLDAPLLYNDARGVAVMDKLRAIAPPNHTVLSATSSLAKLLWWEEASNFSPPSHPPKSPSPLESPLKGGTSAEPLLKGEVWRGGGTQLSPLLKGEDGRGGKGAGGLGARYFLHQADWLAFLLHGQLGISDYHNALKLGYDVENLRYPDWLTNLPLFPLLPKVVVPGTSVAPAGAAISDRFGLRQDCMVCAGTTDSIAAFLASGALEPGEAVTSLGSTLVLKLLSHTRVEDSRYGIYSHRLGDLWLTGGASNTGGAVLRQFFSDAELESFSYQIDPQTESQLDYYPLLQPGDRFPINDPNLSPRLEPRPENPVEFLHGLLESMARIEARGYELLQQLGATRLSRVYTAGGGAKNPVWSKMRERYLQVPVVTSVHMEAAYGAALLAMRGIENEPPRRKGREEGEER